MAKSCNPDHAPFIYSLGVGGALFVNSFAVSHPSQPNYFVLFSDSTQNVSDNKYYFFDAPTLAGALSAAHISFAGYTESGSPHKHDRWESFTNSRTAGRRPIEFPDDFTRFGARVRPGQYAERITHHRVIRTLLEMYALPPFADVVTTPPIRAIWDAD